MHTRSVRILFLILFCLVLTFVLLVLRSVGPGGDGVIAELQLPDGSHLEVSQKWNGWESWSEPYTVSLHTLEEDGSWKWHYVDHEAGRWYKGRLEHNESAGTVELHNGKTLRGRYVLRDREWELVR